MQCSTDKSKGILFRKGKCNYCIDKRIILNDMLNPPEKKLFGGFSY